MEIMIRLGSRTVKKVRIKVRQARTPQDTERIKRLLHQILVLHDFDANDDGRVLDMRATGIVRRIDELGRVVIPKEIRRTLRIREGDPLEIFTDHDGEVVLKKYSPIGEIATIAKDYTDSLYRSLGLISCICDRDMVVSASGSPKRELWEKPLSIEMESAMQNRQQLKLSVAQGAKIIPVTTEEGADQYTAQVIVPILSDGEVIGALVLLSREQGYVMDEASVKVAETTANIVGRQMEQ